MVWWRSVSALAFVAGLAACKPDPAALGGYREPPPDGTPIVCPVTKERCTKGPQTESAIFQMRTFYFCRPESRAVFAENPERYAFD